MPLDLLIRNAQVVTPTGVEPLSVGIAEGRIVDLAPEISDPAKESIDAKNLHLFHGLIDAHVHFNDAGEGGRSHWEGVATGSAALSAGGGTVFFDMPLNSSPPTLDGPAFDLKLAACQKSSRTDFALWGGLTPDNLDHLEELADRGVIGFKAFMSNSGIEDFTAVDDHTLYQGMKIAARLGLPVAVHAENDNITTRLSKEALAAGKSSIQDYLDSRPVIAEVDAIRRAIAFAQDTGCALHIVHISSAWGNMEVVEAKHLWLKNQPGTRPLDITSETCPHYLALTDADLHRIGACAKCAPPLRDAQTVAMLWKQLESGGFDFVASDHSPSPPDMKTDPNFFKIWGGIAGVQSTLPILLSHTPALPLPQVAALTAANVARRFRIPAKGSITLGNDADLTLIDLSASYELQREHLLDRHKLSPYVGRTFRGLIRRTLLRGQTIFLDGELPGKPAGKLLRPKRSKPA